jgi:regulator of sigma D
MNQERQHLIAHICKLVGLKPEYFDDWSDEQLAFFFSDLMERLRKR